MHNYGTLPMTGASVTFAGIVFDQIWLLAVGIVAVALGVTLIRMQWRRGRSVTDR